MKKTFSCLVIINKKGQFLLQDRTGLDLKGDWGFFGGKGEPGETPEQTLEREIGEELDISNFSYAKCFEDLSYPSKGATTAEFYCFCHITDREFAHDFQVYEGNGAEYFYLEEMKSLNLIDSWEYQNTIFQSALAIFDEYKKNHTL